MSEQWFLDLDGVRSGPYQTSEVMSLVAEGEILPHHQIATDLKSQKWMTILEWRLNQNRTGDHNKEAAALATSTFSPLQEKPEAIKPVTPVTPAPTPKATPEPEPIKLETPPTPSVPKIVPPQPRTDATGKPKRDPMAEMFDMLQDTKQKREVKSQQSAQAHAANTTHSPAASAPGSYTSKSSGGWGKTIAIGFVITIIGFALGQFFQHQKSSETTTTAASTAPSPSVSAKPSSTPEVMETMDRSTDKMTIRAQVPANNNAAAPAAAAPEHAKDIQELKDLKKELLELKALKDEIRNNNDTGHMDNAVPNDNRNMNNDDHEPENGDNPAVDENGNPENPAAPKEDVHY